MLTLIHKSPAVFLLLSALLLTGCSNDSPGPSLSWLPPDAVILAFGDSLTQGTGARPEESYPARLEQLTGRTVINAGIAGELSQQGKERLPTLLDRHQPQLLILCHAGNDILRKQNMDVAAANLRSMIEMAHQRGIEVLLLAVPEPGLRLRDATLYDEVAVSTGTPLLAGLLADVLSRNRYRADTVHPNADGYAAMAEAIAMKLQRAGALDTR